MSLESKTLKVCSCNRTLALDAKALAAALKLGEPLTVHHELCRKDIGAFQAALGSDDDVIVACTQEAALFSEMSPEEHQVREHPRAGRVVGREVDAEDRGADRDGDDARGRARARRSTSSRRATCW